MKTLFFRVFDLFYLNGIIFYLSYLLCRFWLKPATRLDFAVQFFGLSAILITGTAIFFGSMFMMKTMVLNIFFTILLCLLIFINFKIKIKHTIKDNKVPKNIPKPEIFFVVFFAVSGILTLLLITWNSMRYPPIDYDVMYFYLPTMVNWLKTGGLSVWKEAMIDAKYYPCGFFIFHYWLVLILKSDFLIWIIQPLFLIFSVANLYAIARKLGVSGVLFFAFCISMVCMLFTISLSVKENNDIGTLYFFSVAVYFILVFNKTNLIRYLFTASAATGCVLGIKYSGLHWCLALSAGMILSVFKADIKRKFIAVFAWFCGVGLWGSYWYIRNLILTGNFIFPAKLKIAGVKFFTPNDLYSKVDYVFMEKVNSSSILQHPDYLLTKSLDWYFPVFGIMYFLAGISILYILWFLIKSAWKRTIDDQTILFTIILAGAVLLTTIPATLRTNSNIRYGFHIIVFLVSIIPLIFYRNKILSWILLILFSANIVYGLSMYTKYVVVIIPLAFIAGICITALYSKYGLINLLDKIMDYIAKRKSVFMAVNTLILIVAIMGISNIVSAYRFDPEDGYVLIDQYLNDGWKWLDENVKGKKIGIVDNSYLYPLFNTDFSNEIVSVYDNNKLNFYKNIDTNDVDYLFFQSRREWINGINVFVYKFPPQQMWAQEKNYEEVFRNQGVSVFAIKNQAR